MCNGVGTMRSSIGECVVVSVALCCCIAMAEATLQRCLSPILQHVPGISSGGAGRYDSMLKSR